MGSNLVRQRRFFFPGCFDIVVVFKFLFPLCKSEYVGFVLLFRGVYQRDV